LASAIGRYGAHGSHLPKIYDFKHAGCGPISVRAWEWRWNLSRLTKIGEYAAYRAGMLLNHRYQLVE
jgi:hypothetical protein